MSTLCDEGLPTRMLVGIRWFRHTVGRSVAQPGSALASGARGREFESPRSDQCLFNGLAAYGCAVLNFALGVILNFTPILFAPHTH